MPLFSSTSPLSQYLSFGSSSETQELGNGRKQTKEELEANLAKIRAAAAPGSDKASNAQTLRDGFRKYMVLNPEATEQIHPTRVLKAITEKDTSALRRYAGNNSNAAQKLRTAALALPAGQDRETALDGAFREATDSLRAATTALYSASNQSGKGYGAGDVSKMTVDDRISMNDLQANYDEDKTWVRPEALRELISLKARDILERDTGIGEFSQWGTQSHIDKINPDQLTAEVHKTIKGILDEITALHTLIQELPITDALPEVQKYGGTPPPDQKSRAWRLKLRSKSEPSPASPPAAETKIRAATEDYSAARAHRNGIFFKNQAAKEAYATKASSLKKGEKHPDLAEKKGFAAIKQAWNMGGTWQELSRQGQKKLSLSRSQPEKVTREVILPPSPALSHTEPQRPVIEEIFIETPRPSTDQEERPDLDAVRKSLSLSDNGQGKALPAIPQGESSDATRADMENHFQERTVSTMPSLLEATDKSVARPSMIESITSIETTELQTAETMDASRKPARSSLLQSKGFTPSTLDAQQSVAGKDKELPLPPPLHNDSTEDVRILDDHGRKHTGLWLAGQKETHFVPKPISRPSQYSTAIPVPYTTPAPDPQLESGRNSFALNDSQERPTYATRKESVVSQEIPVMEGNKISSWRNGRMASRLLSRVERNNATAKETPAPFSPPVISQARPSDAPQRKVTEEKRKISRIPTSLVWERKKDKNPPKVVADLPHFIPATIFRGKISATQENLNLLWESDMEIRRMRAANQRNRDFLGDPVFAGTIFDPSRQNNLPPEEEEDSNRR